MESTGKLLRIYAKRPPPCLALPDGFWQVFLACMKNLNPSISRLGLGIDGFNPVSDMVISMLELAALNFSQTILFLRLWMSIMNSI